MTRMIWNNRLKFISTIVLGALLNVYVRSAAGRRRAQVPDKLIHSNRKMRAGIDAITCDIKNRTGGVAIATRKIFTARALKPFLAISPLVT